MVVAYPNPWGVVEAGRVAMSQRPGSVSWLRLT